VWFTVAGGALSDVYYPTIDNTNVETLQYIVTDGSTFTDLQTRDMVSTATALDDSGMSCRVTTTANSGKYKIITDYVTDPDRNTLLIAYATRHHRVAARVEPTSSSTCDSIRRSTATAVAGRETAVAIRRSPIRPRATRSRWRSTPTRSPTQPTATTPAGVRRPRRAVHQRHQRVRRWRQRRVDPTRQRPPIDRVNESADNGNVVQVAQVDTGRRGRNRDVTFALGFGATQAEAVGTAEASLRRDFDNIRRDYETGWQRYDRELNEPPQSLPGLSPSRVRELRDEYYLSINVVKAAEDKTFPGAIVAGLSSPWGQAISAGDPNNTYFGSYREVFSRDLYEAWTGLMAAGDLDTARAATLFLFERQQLADGSMPRNSLVNGKTAPDSFGTQLDEVAYPILMAHQLGLTDATLYAQHIKPAANFIVARGPSFGAERWEEQSGFSPSTIAAEIAGLLAGADLADGQR
jgi:GH15 family glucan-1,4-alpha-glucosidase